MAIFYATKDTRNMHAGQEFYNIAHDETAGRRSRSGNVMPNGKNRIAEVLNHAYIYCSGTKRGRFHIRLRHYYTTGKRIRIMKQSLMLLLLAGLFAIGLSGCDDNAATETKPSPNTEAGQPANATRPPAAEKQETQAQAQADTQSVAPPSPATARPAGEGANTSAPQPEETPAMLEAPLGVKDLLHRRFVLKKADGKDVSRTERPVDLEFIQSPDAVEGLQVAGSICNRYSGNGNVENGLLTVKRLRTTRMLCPDQQLNALEQLFAGMLEQGADVTFKDRSLILRQGQHELVFEAADWVR